MVQRSHQTVTAALRKDRGANLNSSFVVEKDVKLGSRSEEEFLKGGPFVDPYSLRELSHPKGIGVREPSSWTPIEVPINRPGDEFIKPTENARVGLGVLFF